MPSRIDRRRLLEAGGLAMLAACAPFSKSSPFYGTLRAGLGSSPQGSVTRAYADSLPYASIRAWFTGRSKGLLVLGERDAASNFTWFGRNQEGITTFGPFVTRVLGPDVELRRTLFSGHWNIDLRKMAGTRVSRTVTLHSEKGFADERIESSFRAEGLETVDVFGHEMRLQRIVEHLTAGGHPRFANSYWIEPATGRCWKSRQLAVPTLPPLNVELAQYPAGA